MFDVKSVNIAYFDALHEANFKVCKIFVIKLINIYYKANSLFVYEVNRKIRSEANYKANNACYNVLHETNFRVLL